MVSGRLAGGCVLTLDYLLLVKLDASRRFRGSYFYTPTYCRDARLHLVFEPRTKGGAWWRVATASGVSGEGRKAGFADPRCRTVRNGCKPLHAHSSCLGTTASGQHWEAPITVPVGEPTPPVPAHLRTWIIALPRNNLITFSFCTVRLFRPVGARALYGHPAPRSGSGRIALSRARKL